MHILLVEDDSAITMGLDYTLKKEGYAVCICMSVEQARAALSKQRFDLALIDLSLPDGSGIPVEQRAPEEVSAFAGTPTGPAGVSVWNPAFDVTPHQLLTGIITERGVLYPPFGQSLTERFSKV